MLLLQGTAESLKQISNPVVITYTLQTYKDIIIAFNGTTGDTQTCGMGKSLWWHVEEQLEIFCSERQNSTYTHVKFTYTSLSYTPSFPLCQLPCIPQN